MLTLTQPQPEIGIFSDESGFLACPLLASPPCSTAHLLCKRGGNRAALTTFHLNSICVFRGHQYPQPHATLV